MSPQLERARASLDQLEWLVRNYVQGYADKDRDALVATIRDTLDLVDRQQVLIAAQQKAIRETDTPRGGI